MLSLPENCKLLNKIGEFFPPPEILRMTTLGIDISEDAVRYVGLKQTSFGKEVDCFGGVDIPKGVIKRGEVRKPEELAKIFKQIKEESGYEFIRSSLPDERSYLFQTTIPGNITPEEVRTTLEFKLEEYVPISAVDAVFDYTVSKTCKKNKEDGEQTISVSVFSRKLIGGYLKSFEESGFTVFSLETDAQALLRSVVPEGDNTVYLVVNFGESRTNLSVVGGGLVCFTATLDIGGDDITEAIRKNLSISEKEAEKIKKEKGFSKNKANKDLFLSMVSAISALKDEIKKYISYWQSRLDSCVGAGDEIEKIILCGTSASIFGLKEYLEESMKIPTRSADVWVNAFSLKDVTPPMHKDDSFAFATGIGIALRREGKE